LTIANPDNYLIDLKIQRGGSPKQQRQIGSMPAFGTRDSCSVHPDLARKYTLRDVASHPQPPDKRTD
jgi:hypothetical protein